MKMRTLWESLQLPELQKEESRGGGKAPFGQKRERSEGQKKRLQEMTSHSPLFPLLPQMVQETVSGCRDTMGSALI